VQVKTACDGGPCCSLQANNCFLRLEGAHATGKDPSPGASTAKVPPTPKLSAPQTSGVSGQANAM
jgi:hypothetical protein